MKRPQTYLLVTLAICVIAIILVRYKIEDGRKNRDESSTISHDERTSLAEPGRGMNGGMPRSTHRQRRTHVNISVLSRLGYVLTADDVGDHTAKGNVVIITPEGDILKSESMSISSDGDNIFLYGSISAVSESGIVRRSIDVNSFARIALDGSSQTFQGVALYSRGTTKK